MNVFYTLIKQRDFLYDGYCQQGSLLAFISPSIRLLLGLPLLLLLSKLLIYP